MRCKTLIFCLKYYIILHANNRKANNMTVNTDAPITLLFLSTLGQQVDFLSKTRHLYVLPGGCLNVSAINGLNLDHIAESIHLALTTSLRLSSF